MASNGESKYGSGEESNSWKQRQSPGRGVKHLLHLFRFSGKQLLKKFIFEIIVFFYLKFKIYNWSLNCENPLNNGHRDRPVKSRGKGGKFSRAPRCLGGSDVAEKYRNWCSRWLLSDLKYA